MASMAHKRKLFAAHLADLQSTYADFPDIVACPICMRMFDRGAIEAMDIDDGHVWPDGIRQRDPSGRARHQQVLLCRKCNSTSGSRNDDQMRKFDALMEQYRTGKLDFVGTVEVTTGPDQKPVSLQARVTADNLGSREDGMTANLAFDVDKKSGQWGKNDSKNQEEMQSILQRGVPFTLSHTLPPSFDHNRARAGWVTSAYLLAFYALGYRYISTSTLNPLRAYILTSLHGQEESIPDLSSVIGASANPTQAYHPTPKLGMVVPLIDQPVASLRVYYLQWQVTLPLCHTDDLAGIIGTVIPEFPKLIADDDKAGGELFIHIRCTKTQPHECIWDSICKADETVNTA